MGTLIYRIVTNPNEPFDYTMFDACIDPQFNGVFPDDPALGIVSERKANDTNTRTIRDNGSSQDFQSQPNDPSPSRDR